METTLTEIRNFYAIEVDDSNIDYLSKCHLRTIAYSCGVYGCNGRLYFNETDNKFYKITGRKQYLFML